MVKKKAVVAIDNDSNFLYNTLEGILDELGLLTDYQYRTIEPRGRTPEEVVQECLDGIRELLTENLTVEIVLVDIVIFESEEEDPEDRTGLDIARDLLPILPQVPIVGMTRYIKGCRLISEISQSPYLHGIVIKKLLEEGPFTRKDFLETIDRTKDKARVMVEKIHSYPIEKPKGVEGRFELQDDPRCQYQVLQIGRDTLMVLLESLFSSGQGTVTYLRPGFSGSYLFKVSVKIAAKGISTSATKTWVVKLCDDKKKLRDELERSVRLKNRVLKELYPQLLKPDLTVVGKWAALAFEMQEDAITFSEYLQQGYSIKDITKLIENSLIPFLQEHYGDPKREQCFYWRKFYPLDKKTEAGILIFLNEVQTIPRKLSHISKKSIQMIKDIVEKEERPLSNMHADVATHYVHGDLHCRNILVADNASKLVFIDFANSNQDHYMKDIAKLETDLIFLVMDSRNWNHTDWQSVTDWEQILGLYTRDEIFVSRKLTGRSEVVRIMKLIQALRKGLESLGGDQPDEQQYLIALLHYTLKVLSYPDVSVQKKAFAVRYIQEILNAISVD